MNVSRDIFVFELVDDLSQIGSRCLGELGKVQPEGNPQRKCRCDERYSQGRRCMNRGGGRNAGCIKIGGDGVFLERGFPNIAIVG